MEEITTENKRTTHFWTREETEILKQGMYEKQTPEELQEKLPGRTVKSITAKMRRLQETMQAVQAEPAPEPEEPAPPEPEKIRFSDEAEVYAKGYGFVRSASGDIFLTPQTVQNYRIQTGDVVSGLAQYSPERGSFVLLELDSVERGGEKIEDIITADGREITGYLEVFEAGYGFLRRKNLHNSADDVFVSERIIRSLNLRSGDKIKGEIRSRMEPGNQLRLQLRHVVEVNDKDVRSAINRRTFEKMTPVHPHEKLKMEKNATDYTGRIIDLLAPIGKGQRAMINAQPKTGKTTILTSLAHSIEQNHPDVHLIILLIDERPEEVTDFHDELTGKNTEIVSSTFDMDPENHLKAAEHVLNRAISMVEMGEDVVVLMDSLTRLTRACNLASDDSGARLSGGLNPAALSFPKSFFGAARSLREGGSLTIIATALVETGSRMDDVIFEEFKGTGNMELSLDRGLARAREYPAVNIAASGTRRDEKLLNEEERNAERIIMEKLPSNPLNALRFVKKAIRDTPNNENLCHRLHFSRSAEHPVHS